MIKCANNSGQWDSNPRPSRWQRDALPLSYVRKILVRITLVRKFWFAKPWSVLA